jgi:hypothetical protein
MLSEFLKDIIQSKKGDLLDLPENELQFNPYIIQRFLSMQSPMMCDIVNQTTNPKMGVLDKKQLYLLMLSVVPRLRSTSFKYIKKEETGILLNEKEKKAVDLLAQRYKLSKKDIEQYIKELDLNIDKYTRGLD